MRTKPALVFTFVGSVWISRFSSSCRMYFTTVLALMPVLADPSNARPALVGFSVLAKHQVGVNRQLPWTQTQCKNFIRQKKISPQWAALCVSVFDFRTATSKMIFQHSTPMFQPMSIENSKFTLRSQAFLASVLQNYFAEALFFVFSTADFEASLP